MKLHKTSILRVKDGFTQHHFSKKSGAKQVHPAPASDRSGAGFSLIETLVVVGLFGMLIALGLLLSMDAWRGTSFQSEQDIVISLLYKARSRAISNINRALRSL